MQTTRSTRRCFYSLLVCCALTIAACGDEVAADLKDYSAHGFRDASELSDAMFKHHKLLSDSLGNGSLKFDEYQGRLKREILPEISGIVDKYKSYKPKTREVAKVQSEYVAAYESIHSAYSTMSEVQSNRDKEGLANANKQVQDAIQERAVAWDHAQALGRAHPGWQR